MDALIGGGADRLNALAGVIDTLNPRQFLTDC
jgi:hypothetical protein